MVTQENVNRALKRVDSHGQALYEGLRVTMPGWIGSRHWVVRDDLAEMDATTATRFKTDDTTRWLESPRVDVTEIGAMRIPNTWNHEGDEAFVSELGQVVFADPEGRRTVVDPDYAPLLQGYTVRALGLDVASVPLAAFDETGDVVAIVMPAKLVAREVAP